MPKTSLVVSSFMKGPDCLNPHSWNSFHAFVLKVSELGQFTFPNLTFVLNCFSFQFQCVDLLSAGPHMNCALWQGLIFAFSLLKILFFFFLWCFTAIWKMFQLSEELNVICYSRYNRSFTTWYKMTFSLSSSWYYCGNLWLLQCTEISIVFYFCFIKGDSLNFTKTQLYGMK